MADLLETDLAFMSLILALLNLSGYRAAVGRMPFGNKNLDHVLRQVRKSTNFLRSLALRQPKIARRLVASGKPPDELRPTCDTSDRQRPVPLDSLWDRVAQR